MPERAPWPRRLALGLSVVGALVSVALEVVHVRAYLAPSLDSFCAFGERLDCASVALSRYAVFLDIPLPLWGFAGFLALGLAAARRSAWLVPLAAVAALAGVGLTALGLIVLGVICPLCEVVHALSLAILVAAWRARPELSRPSGSLPLGAPEETALVLAPPLGLLLAALAFVPPYWSVSAWKGDLPLAHGKTADGYPWVGAEQPRLVLEQFVDYSCPHCKAESAQTALRLAAHSDSLRVVRRFFPRLMCSPPEEPRCRAVRIALCADEQDRFWQADRWLFENVEGTEPSPAEAAEALGLDAARLAECVSRPATFERAAAEWRAAKKQHIPGTPYYRVDGRRISSSEAVALIDSL